MVMTQINYMPIWSMLPDEDWLNQAAAEAWAEAQSQERQEATVWPTAYRNNDTGKAYAPHHDQERRFVYDDQPRYALAKGGEGAGKSVAGIIKALGRIARKMSGIMVSPDLPHFKKSLWPEFRRWCPWEHVIPSQRRRANLEWSPSEAFEMVFDNGAVLLCGGIESPMSWEGPNVNFALFDEARRAPDAGALKVLDGRIRIPGPQGEPPQLFLTTTPRLNWLYEYFGPMVTDDPHDGFKRDSLVVDLLTVDNERAGNLSSGYTQDRAKSLTASEARVLLEAAWEDIDSPDRFLSSMILWDANREALPPLGANEPLVIAIDAGVSNDSFGMVGITPHPTRQGDYAVRFAHEWKPPHGGKIDFRGSKDAPGPDWLIRNVYAPKYALVEVVYDPFQLESLCADLMRDGVIQCVPFSQQKDRLEADKFLYDTILARRLAHDGNETLRKHIDNANAKPDPQSRRLRIVKRAEALKIDLVVTCSMALMSIYRLGV